MKPLFDTREALAPVGTKDWAVFCRNKMQVSVDRDRQSEDQFNDYWSEFLENRGWEPLGFKDYREFAMSKRPDGLAMTQRQFLILCEHAVQSFADQRPVAEATKEKQQGKRTDLEPLSNGKKLQGGGNGVDYTLRRLARDNPEMLDRIEAGELSVNAAAIAAGIRKKPTHAEICVKAFRKADNRMEAMRLITSELEPHEAAVVRDWIVERLH